MTAHLTHLENVLAADRSGAVTAVATIDEQYIVKRVGKGWRLKRWYRIQPHTTRFASLEEADAAVGRLRAEESRRTRLNNDAHDWATAQGWGPTAIRQIVSAYVTTYADPKVVAPPVQVALVSGAMGPALKEWAERHPHSRGAPTSGGISVSFGPAAPADTDLASRVQRTLDRVITEKVQRSLDRGAESLARWHCTEPVAGRPRCAGKQFVRHVVEPLAHIEGKPLAFCWRVVCRNCGPLADVAQLELDS